MTSDRRGNASDWASIRFAIGVPVSQCGFEPYDRDDGLHPDRAARVPRYNAYLRRQGYHAANPLGAWANSGQAPMMAQC